MSTPNDPLKNEEPLDIESSAGALDALHVDEIGKAFEELERLLAAATPGPWFLSDKAGDAVVTDILTEKDNLKWYGGHPVFESCCQADREFIVALRNAAEKLIFQCKNIHALVADLDEVHAALGIDYNQQAAPEVRRLMGLWRDAHVENIADRERFKAQLAQIKKAAEDTGKVEAEKLVGLVKTLASQNAVARALFPL